jgi:hypothetical protein
LNLNFYSALNQTQTIKEAGCDYDYPCYPIRIFIVLSLSLFCVLVITYISLYVLVGKYFHDIVLVPLVPLGKSWPLMCVDVCGDVCVMCVCVVEMQAMAPMAPKLWHQSATRFSCYATIPNGCQNIITLPKNGDTYTSL